MRNKRLHNLDGRERIALFNNWLAGKLTDTEDQEITEDLARQDSLIFGAIRHIDEAVQPLISGKPVRNVFPRQVKPIAGVARTFNWRIAAAAAVFIVMSVSLLALRHVQKPDIVNAHVVANVPPQMAVDALEARAMRLQNAPAQGREVRTLRDDLVNAPLEVAALAWQSEELVAFMAKTRPTTETAYEAELKSQVSHVMAAAGQKPLADLPARYGAYVNTVRASVRQLAGDSGGNVDPELQGFLVKARTVDPVGMIIPFYFYTMDETDALSWDRIVSLSDKRLPVKLVNTRQYTDDLVQNKQYVDALGKAIDGARQRDVEVYAYVNCDGGLKKRALVEADVRNWHALLGKRIQGIYFDNQAMVKDSRLEFFRRVFNLTKELEPTWKIISATDRECDEAFIKLSDDSIICYKTDIIFPKFKGWEKPYGSDRFGAIIHNVDSLVDSEFMKVASVFGWVFVAEKAEPLHIYKALPDYLEKEAAIIKGLNSRAPLPGTNTNKVTIPKRSA